MTPSPDGRAADGDAADSPSARPVPDDAYDAAFGRALRHAVDAAPPDVPPPALLAAILGGGVLSASHGTPAGTDPADVVADDTTPPAPGSLIVHRTRRASDESALEIGDRGRWRPVPVRPGRRIGAVAAVTLLFAVGGIWYRANSVDAVAPFDRAAHGGVVPQQPPPVDTSKPALVSVFLQGPRPGSPAVGRRPVFLEELAPDSAAVLLRASRTVVTRPVAAGVAVAVPAGAGTAEATLARAIAGAAADIPSRCAQLQLRERFTRPEVVHVDLASLAGGSALTRARQSANTDPRTRALAIGRPTLLILRTLTSGVRARSAPSAETTGLRDNAVLRRADLQQAIVTVRYPEVCEHR